LRPSTSFPTLRHSMAYRDEKSICLLLVVRVLTR
jgi:hypothetical protein